MSKAPDSILDLVRKVRELADHGVAGERDAAARKLDLLLKKHGLTLEDLTSQEQIEIMVKANGLLEIDLFLQVCGMICRTSKITYQVSKNRRRVWFKCTLVQSRDIQAAWSHYQRLFRRDQRDQQRALFLAFVNKYGLANPDSDGSNAAEMSEEEYMRIRRLMANLTGEAWAKPLAQL
jgi:hypothetical protein